MKTLVIIPTYNEASTIEKTINGVLTLPENLSVLVVDDNSPDGTAKLVEGFQQIHSSIHLLKRSKKQGLGIAYLAGFGWAFDQGFEFVVQMDADGSHRSQDLPALLAKSKTADLVIGSRWVPGGQVLNWPKSRQLISNFGNSYAKFMLRTKISDMTSGFRVYRAKFLSELLAQPVSSHGYSFQVELAYRAASRGVVAEVPITFVERVNGKSKMTLAIVLEALTKVTLWGFRRFFD